MLRGEISEKSGVDFETIRFYEKMGLLQSPKRNTKGYREYDTVHLTQLKFIRHCRSLGMSLDEIKEIGTFSSQDQADCKKVDLFISDKIKLVEKRIKELKTLKVQLQQLLTTCSNANGKKECQILLSFAQGAFL